MDCHNTNDKTRSYKNYVAVFSSTCMFIFCINFTFDLFISLPTKICAKTAKKRKQTPSVTKIFPAAVVT